MKDDHAPFMMAMVLFAIGAVAVILYQHASGTKTVVAAIGGANPPVTVPPAIQAGDLAPAGVGSPVSLAGSPTPGQASRGAQQDNVVPLTINPGYLLA